MTTNPEIKAGDRFKDRYGEVKTIEWTDGQSALVSRVNDGLSITVVSNFLLNHKPVTEPKPVPSPKMTL